MPIRIFTPPTPNMRYAGTACYLIKHFPLRINDLDGVLGVARDPRKPYSMFCTCSRICSISTFMSTEMRVSSRDADLEPNVLASRCSS